MKITRNENTITMELEITPEDRARLSSSGKTKIAFTTGGFKAVDDDLSISINVIWKRPQR